MNATLTVREKARRLISEIIGNNREKKSLEWRTIAQRITLDSQSTCVAIVIIEKKGANRERERERRITRNVATTKIVLLLL